MYFQSLKYELVYLITAHYQSNSGVSEHKTSILADKIVKQTLTKDINLRRF